MPGLWGVPSLHLLCSFIFLYHHQIRVCNEIFLFLQWPSKNSTWLLNKIKKRHQSIINKTFRQCQTFKYINGLEYFTCAPGYRGYTSMFYLMHYSLYSFWYHLWFWKRITLNFYLITSSGKLYLTSWVRQHLLFVWYQYSQCPSLLTLPNCAKVSMFLSRGGLITYALAN